MPPIACGIALWSQGSSWPEMLAAGQRIDALGYDHLWTWDHLYAIYGPPDQPVFESWSALAALARATKWVRIGPLVGLGPYVELGFRTLIAEQPAPYDIETLERFIGDVQPQLAARSQ